MTPLGFPFSFLLSSLSFLPSSYVFVYVRGGDVGRRGEMCGWLHTRGAWGAGFFPWGGERFLLAISLRCILSLYLKQMHMI
jgi:hypothetical protein